jgi:HNH endonuclease
MQQRLDHYTKVDPLSGCHIWQRSTKPNGYGQLTFRMRRLMAHRVAWIARHGPIAKGLEVCHRCDERRCCNPDHLYLGSHAENMAEMKAKRRALRRLPLDFKDGRWPSALPDDVDEADLAQVRLFVGDREYVGRVVVRPFDPMRTDAKTPPRAPTRRPARR